jgi:hypothetical protein
MKYYNKHYRIKKITLDNKVMYQPQTKFLWFWYNIDKSYDTLYWSTQSIKSHILSKKKPVVECVEYLKYFEYVDDKK